jgi:hypothetical protein
MLLPTIHSRKAYRTFLVIYINPHTQVKKRSGNPNFFTFRINSRNCEPVLRPIRRAGFKINAVYYKAVHRQSGAVIQTRLS